MIKYHTHTHTDKYVLFLQSNDITTANYGYQCESNNGKTPQLLYVLASPNAFPPIRMYPTSAGMDLSSCENFEINPESLGVINTGLRIAIPIGHYGRIAARSSNCLQHLTIIVGGVIDHAYSGIVQVMIYNLSKSRKYIIKPGDRIAQLIIEKCAYPDLIKVDHIDNHCRGNRGFGSSGIKHPKAVAKIAPYVHKKFS